MSLFAQKVYKAVLTIPSGEVRTYSWVANKIGSPRAYRAVGQALKHNPAPIKVPCHRVIRSDGNPGGYIFGVKIKQALIDLERFVCKGVV